MSVVERAWALSSFSLLTSSARASSVGGTTRLSSRHARLSSSGSSARFALRSVTIKLMPVALRLDRLRPAVTASVPAESTIGMVAVAAYPQKSLS
jgi:hypothetical protein